MAAGLTLLAPIGSFLTNGKNLLIVGAVLAIGGLVAYHFYEMDSLQSKITSLTTQNATLQGNVTALNNSVDGYKKEVAADQEQQAMLQAEVTAAQNTDQTNQDILNHEIANATSQAAVAAAVTQRNTNAAAVVTAANDNMACLLNSFANGATGSCDGATFTPSTTTPTTSQ
jgi:regulator of protease activity HflC (stomatin/prohibitin superfamily)